MALIDPQTESRAAELIVCGQLSCRAIAKRLGVSRGTICAMANGRRPMNASRRAASRAAQSHSEQPRSRGRCPTCGARVQRPCRACAVRKRRRKRGFDLSGPADLAIDLHGPARARYQECRRRKIAALCRDLICEARQRAWADPRDELEPSESELRAIQRREGRA